MSDLAPTITPGIVGLVHCLGGDAESFFEAYHSHGRSWAKNGEEFSWLTQSFESSRLLGRVGFCLRGDYWRCGEFALLNTSAFALARFMYYVLGSHA